MRRRLRVALTSSTTGWDAALEVGVELVLDELRLLRSGAGFSVRDEAAVCCCTRRYSVVCSGRWLSWWTGAPSDPS